MIDKLDEMLRFHSEALGLRAFRQQLLASNIANADTPNYKARDIDFHAALKARMSDPALAATAKAAGTQPALLYRSVLQPAADGNTVDMDIERAQFAENAARYDANLTFLNAKIKAMLAAIQG